MEPEAFVLHYSSAEVCVDIVSGLCRRIDCCYQGSKGRVVSLRVHVTT